MATEHMDVSVDATQALLVLRNGAKRQRFAIANALNQTAKLIQSTIRDSVFKKFHVRRRDFLLRQVAIIKPFASAPQGRLEVRVAVGERTRLLLSMFEAGGVRTPFKGRNVAIPVVGGARPSIGAEVAQSLLVTELGLHRAGGRKGNGPVVGAHGTYVVPGAGIYQTVTGTTRGRLLYAFKPTVRIDARLHWKDTARAIAIVHAPVMMAKQVEATFRDHFVQDIAAGLRAGG